MAGDGESGPPRRERLAADRRGPGTDRADAAMSMRIVFAGTPEFAATILGALIEARREVVAVYTQPDRPAGRGRRVQPSPVKALAEGRGLPVRQPSTLRSDAAQRELASLDPTVMVVAAYGLILPRAILDIPRLGCVNVHASLLPRWRGAAPIQRAILAGDHESGVSIMRMSEGLDTGPVYCRRRCAISDVDTAQTLHDRLAEIGIEALSSTLEALETGRATAREQDEPAATYARRIEKSEARLDWTEPAAVLFRAVRAFNPRPVAYTTMPGAGDRDGGSSRLRVWSATPLPGGRPAERPGTILAAGEAGIDVATGDGTLRLLAVQRPGGRRMAAREFLHAHPLVPGSVLGDEEE